MQKIIRAEIGIQIKDVDQFMEYLANYYDCEDISEVDDDMVHEFLNDHIKAHSTVNDLFRIVGGDTDGWLLNSIREV